MAKVLDFNRKLYLKGDTIALTLEDNSDTMSERLARIRTSLDKISVLMGELKEKATKEKATENGK